MNAVVAGNFDAVKSLIASGANVNEAGPDGTTPLMVAAEGTEELQGAARMVKLLLSAHARPDLVDAQGRSALYRSAGEGRPNAMLALLDEHANPNQQANDGSTPLMEAVKFARPNAARVLLEHGADVNLADANKITPLMIAAESSQYIKNPGAYIKMLLHHGAKRGLKDSRGRIAFQHAVETKNQEAITALR
jgi:ankyrin repeat protein